MSFKQFKQDLNEVLITLGNKAYPKFGNIVILAGGAGSGKGYVQENLLGIEGKVLDVDALKKLAMSAPGIIKAVKAKYGKDISKFNLARPDDVKELHAIVKDMNLADNKNKALFASILAGDPDRKPNIIFDVTLDSFAKFKKITAQVSQLGYKKENIHIVWVVNDVRMAMEQNRGRERVVPEDILISTHKGASTTMDKVIGLSKGLSQYMDGAIVFAFNKKGDDSTVNISKEVNIKDLKKRLKKAEDVGDFDAITKLAKEVEDFEAKYKDKGIRQGKGGFYVIDAKYTVIKQKGKKVDLKQLSKKLELKIKSYTPNKDM